MCVVCQLSSEVSDWVRDSNKLVSDVGDLLSDVDRTVHYNRSLDERQLFQQIDDELSLRCDDSQTRQDIDIYSGRLDRFCQNIDYFIDHEVAPLHVVGAKQAKKQKQPKLARRDLLYSSSNNNH